MNVLLINAYISIMDSVFLFVVFTYSVKTTVKERLITNHLTNRHFLEQLVYVILMPS